MMTQQDEGSGESETASQRISRSGPDTVNICPEGTCPVASSDESLTRKPSGSGPGEMFLSSVPAPSPPRDPVVSGNVSHSSSSSVFPSLGGFAWAKASSIFSAAQNATKDTSLRNISAKLTELLNVSDEEEEAEDAERKDRALEETTYNDKLRGGSADAVDDVPPSPRVGYHSVVSLQGAADEPSARGLVSAVESDSNIVSGALYSPADENDDSKETRWEQQDRLLAPLHSQLMQAEHSIAILQQKEKALVAELEKARTEVMKRSLSSQRIEQVKIDLQQELETSLREAQTKFQDMKASLEARLQAEVKNREAQQKVAEALHTGTSQAKAEAERVQALLEVTRIENWEAQEELRRSVVRAESAMRHAEGQAQMLEQNLRDSEKSRVSQESQLAKLQLELRSIEAQNNTLRERAAAFEVLRDSLGTGSEAPPQDVLRTIKQSHLHTLQLKEKIKVLETKLCDAEHQLSNAHRRIQEIEEYNFSMRNQLNKLEAQPLVASASAYPPVPDTEGSNRNSSLVPVLEARLEAKRERIDALLCEVASLRALAIDQRKKLASGVSSENPFEHAEWRWHFSNRWLVYCLGRRRTQTIERVLRIYSRRVARTRFVVAIDRKFRNLINHSTNTLGTRFILLVYLTSIHYALLRFVFMPAAAIDAE